MRMASRRRPPRCGGSCRPGVLTSLPPGDITTAVHLKHRTTCPPRGEAFSLPERDLQPGTDTRQPVHQRRHRAIFLADVLRPLGRAQHRRDVERFAVFEDRDRIARDLHDLVIQRLYATGMSLEGTAALLTEPEPASRVSKAVDALDDTIKQIRSAIFALHSRGEARLPGLRSQILDVVAEMTIPLGFAPALRMAGRLDDQVPEETGEHLLRALREALSNAVRHASATKVEVSIEAGQDLVLTVTDNGVGIKPTKRRSGT